MAKDISYDYQGKMFKFRSKEELYFSWYLDELMDNGFIDKYEYESREFVLMDSIDTPWFEQQKTKVKENSTNVFGKMTYTPDFIIYWTKKAEGVFVGGTPSVKKPYFVPSNFETPENKFVSIVDTKGDVMAHQGRQNFGAFSFPFKQRMMWMRYEAYVHKVIPIKLFRDTFTPERYLLTDKGSQERKVTISKKIKTIDEKTGKTKIKSKKVDLETRSLQQFYDVMKPSWLPNDEKNNDLTQYFL